MFCFVVRVSLGENSLIKIVLILQSLDQSYYFACIDIIKIRSEISLETMDEGGEEDMPRDGKIVKELLKSMNIDDYEPQVIHQLLELWYRYVADVLTDAQMYSEHAEKSVIDSDDIKLAIQSKVNFSFSQPPPREVKSFDLCSSISDLRLF